MTGAPAAPGPPTLPAAAEAETLVARSRAVLDAHWQPEGYTVPNASVYPHQWLWDSCFHAIAWAAVGDADRAVAELTNVFAHQSFDGFVPHMTYWRAPDLHADFWGRRHTSCITQPPMYGHAIAELWRRGIEVPPDLIDAAEAGLRFHLERRPQIVHPWESGCDDSARWDRWCPGGWSPARWKAVKGELVAAIELDPWSEAAVGSSRFSVRSAGFDALVAFNAAELTLATGRPLDTEARRRELAARWDEERRTWADEPHGIVRTLDALLPVLVEPSSSPRVATVFADLADPRAYGTPFGPAGMHPREPAFEPGRYWRGTSWPQLTYLFWVAARQHAFDDEADALGARLVERMAATGFAEHWNPVTGAGLGAQPQSWGALVSAVLLPSPPVPAAALPAPPEPTPEAEPAPPADPATSVVTSVLAGAATDPIAALWAEHVGPAVTAVVPGTNCTAWWWDAVGGNDRRIHVALPGPDLFGLVEARLRAELPATVHGVPVALHESRRWLDDLLGVAVADDGSIADWLEVPWRRFDELAATVVLHDGDGHLTSARSVLAWYPDAVWRHVLACEWHGLASAEVDLGLAGRGDPRSARLAAAAVVDRLERIAFLMARVWPPALASRGRVFGQLRLAGALGPKLDAVLDLFDPSARQLAYCDAASLVARVGNELGLIAPIDPIPAPHPDHGFYVLGADRWAVALADSGGLAHLGWRGAPDQR